uniref:Conotoxin Superfamily M n=1 Tax=Conus episcopatus TaxID=88764 RepID=A0A0K2S5F0_CONEP|nr:Conotoxin Superfamily M [Conus episcopatus]
MMSKLGVLLTICLLLFSLIAVPLDGDQHADQPAEFCRATFYLKSIPYLCLSNGVAMRTNAAVHAGLVVGGDQLCYRGLIKCIMNK